MADPSPEEKAAAERRKVLKEFGITEPDLSSLRALDPEEAKWRIEHERKIMIEFLDKRTKFLLSECTVVKKMLDKSAPDRPEVVISHNEAIGHKGAYPKGQRVG